MSQPVLNAMPSGADSLCAGRGSFVGKRVGPYTICLELASGGMASVFLARTGSSAERTQLVALKVIHPHLAERSDFVEMFVDEAQL
ncbi:MAG TPA: hypothetical protein VM686_25880, partial [Polyangiaceae bacterium]|nr:hypothetical protein [Polyangiaceae bacterium]